MEWGFLFFFNSILLGAGLAMDAFSVSLANGLADPKMKNSRMIFISGVYGVFQFMMPLIGWFFVRTAAEHFTVVQKFIPWISLALLSYIGGKMLYEGIRDWHAETSSQEEVRHLGLAALLVQGIATSIDALSVGFTIESYSALQAFVASLLIGVVTWIICLVGLRIGRTFGTRLARYAPILGGIILIGIGLEIFITNIFG